MNTDDLALLTVLLGMAAYCVGYWRGHDTGAIGAKVKERAAREAAEGSHEFRFGRMLIKDAVRLTMQRRWVPETTGISITHRLELDNGRAVEIVLREVKA